MKLAIIGTGKIVHSALKARADVPQIEVNAIYARPQSRDKGEAIAREAQARQEQRQREELRQQQRSMLNAMLCLAI